MAKESSTSKDVGELRSTFNLQYLEVNKTKKLCSITTTQSIVAFLFLSFQFSRFFLFKCAKKVRPPDLYASQGPSQGFSPSPLTASPEVVVVAEKEKVQECKNNQVCCSESIAKTCSPRKVPTSMMLSR